MNFWFCETCGKRLTDQDLEAGKARDKKLKGVYCADCATGISTQEMAIVTDAQIDQRRAAEPEQISTPVKARRESVRRIEPATSGPISRTHHKPAKPKRSAPVGWIVATALMGGLFVGMILRGTHATPAKAPDIPAGATSTAIAVVPTPAPVPTTPTIPAKLPDTIPVVAPAPGPVPLPAKPIVPEVPATPVPAPVSVVAVTPAPPKTPLVDDEPDATKPDAPKKVEPAPTAPATPAVAAPAKVTPAAPVVPASAVKSVHFCPGEENYAGLVDVAISSSMQANYNKFNGVSARGSTKSSEAGYWCLNAFAKDPSETQVLLAFKQISLPKGAKLVSAQLTLTFDNFWSGGVTGRYLNIPWDPSGLEAKEFGWLNRTPKEKWSNATGGNAGGADGNVLPGLTFSPGPIAEGTNISKTMELDVAVVKRWLDDPTANNGVLLTSEKPGSRVKIHSSSDAKPEARPTLTLKYQ